MSDDDVRLTDLEVIQQFSLAVRGATADRAEVIAALEADLAYLNGSRRRATPAPSKAASFARTPAKVAVQPAPPKPEPAKRAPAKKAPAKKAPAKGAPAKKAPAKRVPAKKVPARKVAAKKVAAKKATRGRRA